MDDCTLAQIQAGCGIGLDLPRIVPRELAGTFRKSRPTGSQGGNKLARREDIDNAIWGDPEFRQLSPDAKLVYLWSFTNPMCGMAGVYKLDAQRMTFETGLNAQRASRAMEQLCERRYLVTDGPWLWIRSRVRYLRTTTPQMAVSIVKDFEQMPEGHPIRVAFVAEYRTHAWLASKGAERWSEFCNATDGSVEPKAEYLNRGSGEPHPRFQGTASASETTPTTSGDKDSSLRIFEHWQKLLAPNARFTPGRREKVKARLKTYPAERILRAIDGCAASEFHVQNGHVDLTLICRSDEKLEQFEALPLKVEGVKGRDGTQVNGPGLLSSRRACRKCAKGITNEQANNQSGMCDEHYAEFENSALGAA